MAKKEKKPLTRKDVLRLIEENEGTARGLNLSEQTFVEAIDLSNLDLHGIILKDARFPTHFEGGQPVGAKFDGSNLNGADLRSIDLSYARFGMLNNEPTHLEAADLRGSLSLNTNFQGADLKGARFGVEEDSNLMPAMFDNTDFRGADLFRANFKDCYFYGTKLEGAFIRGADISNAHLEEADWGSYVIGEENKKDFYSAEHYYRQLKMWYTKSGYYDTAGEFFFREMTARRKAMKWWPKPWNRAISKLLLSMLCGYGEKPERVIVSALVIIFGLAIAYYLWGSFNTSSFWDTLYYSVVSFTAVGYGNWAPQPTGWAKGVGAAEAVLGVFMIALYLITFTRKMTR